jgi:hypothetical protein
MTSPIELMRPSKFQSDVHKGLASVLSHLGKQNESKVHRKLSDQLDPELGNGSRPSSRRGSLAEPVLYSTGNNS